jgi:hypothetical protein
VKPLTLIVGPSGSGKNYISDAFGLKAIQSYTTRPMRSGDKETDHKFVKKDAYKSTCDKIDLILSSNCYNQVDIYPEDTIDATTIMAANNLAAVTKFHGNYYWVSLSDIQDPENETYIIDPSGVVALVMLNSNIKHYSKSKYVKLNKGILRPLNIVWIDSPWYKRFFNMMKRGDGFFKTISRMIHDASVFNPKDLTGGTLVPLKSVNKITILKV